MLTGGGARKTARGPRRQRRFGTRLGERGFVRERIKQGPYKGRMEWLGIGLRVNEHPPDNGGGGGENGSESFDEGSPGERTPDNGSPDVSSLDIDNAENARSSSERSEPFLHITPRGIISELLISFFGSSSFTTTSRILRIVDI